MASRNTCEITKMLATLVDIRRYWQVHRPDLQRALFDRAQELGVTIQTAARVVNLDAETGTVILADGSILSSELTICADGNCSPICSYATLIPTGLSSRTRTALLDNQPSSPRPLPDSVYRAMIPRTTMMARLDTAQLMSSNNSQLFMGPHRALLGYPIARGELYNIAITILNTTTEIDTARVGKWDEPVASSELKTMFHDFCPQVQVLLDLVEHCTKWTIAEVPSLKSWSSASGRAVLLGDAAHAMSPHLAQGGGMAIEDATVLAECLQLVKSVKDDMPAALKCYEAIRKPRVARIAELARDNGASMLLVDGAAQEARDRRLAASMCAGSYAETSAIFREVTPDATAAWPSPPLLKWLYGFDAAGDAKCQLKQLWSSVTNGLVKTVEPTTTPSAAMRTRAA